MNKPASFLKKTFAKEWLVFWLSIFVGASITFAILNFAKIGIKKNYMQLSPNIKNSLTEIMEIGEYIGLDTKTKKHILVKGNQKYNLKIGEQEKIVEGLGIPFSEIPITIDFSSLDDADYHTMLAYLELKNKKSLPMYELSLIFMRITLGFYILLQFIRVTVWAFKTVKK